MKGTAKLQKQQQTQYLLVNPQAIHHRIVL